jgi:Ca2+-binding RTX toxin-like protein
MRAAARPTLAGEPVRIEHAGVRIRAAAVAAATLTGVLVGPTNAEAVAPLCQGKEATIVAAGFDEVMGTEGADVIVAKGNFVDALGGDDVICMTSYGEVNAGTGNDSVLVTAGNPRTRLLAILGPGDDRYIGGPEQDIVDYDIDCDAGCEYDSSGTDVVSTGVGRDTVASSVDQANHDVVDLGPGKDRLIMTLPAGSLAQGSGGIGNDLLVLRGEPVDHSADLNTGVVRRAGVQVATFTRFNTYVLSVPPPGHLQLVGTPRRDRLQLTAERLDVRLGRGDDWLGLGTSSGRKYAVTGLLDLGPGADHVNAQSGWRFIGADLARERLVMTRFAHYRGRLSLLGAEHFTARATRVALHGTPGPNTLRGSGCEVRLRGGAGGDALSASGVRSRGLCRADLAGGPGPDRLTGGDSDDRLVGGPGRDVARGGEGTDTCIAEREVSCEL